MRLPDWRPQRRPVARRDPEQESPARRRNDCWTKSEGGETLTVGTLDARIRFYPSATGGFFLTGGVGLGSISAGVSGLGSASETGLGLLLGLGVDIRVAKNLSFTPFWNGFAVRSSGSDANVGQIGVGLTIH